MKTAKELREIASIVDERQAGDIINDILDRCEEAAKRGLYDLWFTNYFIDNSDVFKAISKQMRDLG